MLGRSEVPTLLVRRVQDSGVGINVIPSSTGELSLPDFRKQPQYPDRVKFLDELSGNSHRGRLEPLAQTECHRKPYPGFAPGKKPNNSDHQDDGVGCFRLARESYRKPLFATGILSGGKMQDTCDMFSKISIK